MKISSHNLDINSVTIHLDLVSLANNTNYILLLQEAFNWEPGKRKVAPYDSFLFEEETDSGPDLSEKLEDIEAQFKSIQVCLLKFL